MRSAKALVVMLKDPAPGRAKTRLSPPLSEDEAAGLYVCFITDLFNRLKGLHAVDLFAAIAADGEDGHEKGRSTAREMIEKTGARAGFIAQEGEGLGERMRNAFKSVFSRGYNKVTMIGSDSPDMPLEFIEKAFDLLGVNSSALILGPATDGGYYLIALNALYEELFEGIPWSTASVLDETVKKARASGVGLSLLDEWHDIDTPEDLSYLKDNPLTPDSSAFLNGLSFFGRTPFMGSGGRSEEGA